MSKEDKEHEETMRNAMNLIKESEDVRQGKSAKTEPKEAPKAPAKKGFWSKLWRGIKKLFGQSSSSKKQAHEAPKSAVAAPRAESHGKA